MENSKSQASKMVGDVAIKVSSTKAIQKFPKIRLLH